MSKFIGIVSAYAYAVSQGYTGTEEEYAELMASYATVAEEAAESAESAQASATTANSAASTATNKASEATTAAQTATDKAGEAAASATTASTAKTDAETARDAAAQSASAAAESARTLTIDSTLTQAGQAADAAETGREVRDVSGIVNSITSEKYEEISGTDEAGKSIPYKGYVTDATTSYHCVYYSDISAGDKFRVSGSTASGGYYYIFTDGTDTLSKSEKNVSSGTASATNLLAVAPEGATTLIVAYNTSSSYVHASVKKITEYTLNECAEYEDRITELESTTGKTESTVSVPDDALVVTNNRYMYTSGAIAQETAGWRYAEYTIPSKAKTVIVTSMAGQSARRWIIKNEVDLVIGYSEYSGSPVINTETVDLSNYPTAKKLYVNDKNSTALAISYTYDKTIINGNFVYVDGNPLPDVISPPSDRLYGKTLCVCGDSITYGADMDAEGITNESDITVFNCNASGDFTQTMSGFRKTWGWQIAHRHKMTLYNAGVSGSTMQAITDKAGFSIANGRYTKLPESIDYLVIWFGWNDNAYGTLGAITDITNESYYGGYNVVLPYLINKYPDCKIALVVPFGTTTGHRNAIRQLGNKWGVAVWDNYQGGTPLYFGKEESVGVDSSIVTANRAKYQANGAHPNYKGHTQLADMIEDFLRGI